MQELLNASSNVKSEYKEELSSFPDFFFQNDGTSVFTFDDRHKEQKNFSEKSLILSESYQNSGKNVPDTLATAQTSMHSIIGLRSFKDQQNFLEASNEKKPPSKEIFEPESDASKKAPFRARLELPLLDRSKKQFQKATSLEVDSPGLAPEIQPSLKPGTEGMAQTRARLKAQLSEMICETQIESNTETNAHSSEPIIQDQHRKTTSIERHSMVIEEASPTKERGSKKRDLKKLGLRPNYLESREKEVSRSLPFSMESLEAASCQNTPQWQSEPRRAFSPLPHPSLLGLLQGERAEPAPLSLSPQEKKILDSDNCKKTHHKLALILMFLALLFVLVELVVF